MKMVNSVVFQVYMTCVIAGVLFSLVVSDFQYLKWSMWLGVVMGIIADAMKPEIVNEGIKIV